METKSFESIMRDSPKELLCRSTEPMAVSDSASSRYAFGASAESKFYRKISALLYGWTDSLFGNKSYLYVKKNFVFSEPYRSMLEYLDRHKMIKPIKLEIRRFNDVPFFYHFNLSGAYQASSTDGNTIVSMYGMGFSKNKEEALSKMIGEFCERYFLTLYKNKNLLRASLRTLRSKKIPAMEIETLAGFSEEQKKENPRFQWSDDSVFWWERAERLSTGKRVFVPAQLVYWNYLFLPDEPILRERNTNGCGGYFTKEGAALSGLYEAVQRDAFLVWWLNARTPPQIDPDSIPDEGFQKILDDARRYGFEVHCLNTTLDTTIPSFAVIVEDRLSGKSPLFSLGGGCGANPGLALRRALEEAWSVHYYVKKYTVNQPPFSLPQGYSPFRTAGIGQHERLMLFANPAMRDHYSVLMSGSKKKFNASDFSYPAEFVSEKEELITAVRCIERLGKGYEVYAFFPRHPILDEFGYASARIIVPRLIPLYLYETHAPLGSERLKTTPSGIGQAGAAMSLNTWPHPFP